jgi:hypothetical protein
MKNFMRIFGLFVYILCTIFLLSTQPAEAQDCLNQLKQFNKVDIPPAQIDEYEKCVSQLGQTQKSNKDLLTECYTKLISYYDKQDNTKKVIYYKAALAKLSLPGAKVPAKTVVKEDKNEISTAKEKKDSPSVHKNKN